MKVVVVAVVIFVAAVAAGAYFLTAGKTSSGSGSATTSAPKSVTIDLSLIESDPVNQVDALSPANITVAHGTTVTLAIQNGDDEARTFEISALNVNVTISSGATNRVTFTAGQAGVYKLYVPPEPPYPGFKASPSVTGYVIVT